MPKVFFGADSYFLRPSSDLKYTYVIQLNIEEFSIVLDNFQLNLLSGTVILSGPQEETVTKEKGNDKQHQRHCLMNQS